MSPRPASRSSRRRTRAGRPSARPGSWSCPSPPRPRPGTSSRGRAGCGPGRLGRAAAAAALASFVLVELVVGVEDLGIGLPFGAGPGRTSGKACGTVIAIIEKRFGAGDEIALLENGQEIVEQGPEPGPVEVPDHDLVAFAAP